MLKVKEIISSGGACPYQCEGWLEDGQFFYLRYRGGFLSLRVGEDDTMFYRNDPIFVKQIGDQYDGCADNELFHCYLDPIIEFPAEFKFTY